MRKFMVAAVLALLAATALALPQKSVSGKWYWLGDAGWQRIALDLKADGKKLTGTIVMGPGEVRNTGADRYWEVFFTPVSFPILNGKIDGSRISFEQMIVRNAGTTEERLKYTGILEGDRIDFTRRSTQQPNDSFVLGDHEYQFIATRDASLTQAPAVVPLKPPSGFRPTTRINVVVRDAAGKNVDGLRLEDFAVVENEVPRPVTLFHPADAPWNVLLLFDHSLAWLEQGAQKDSANYVAGAWRTLVDEASDFLARLRLDDRFAIAAFDDRVETAMDWRAARDANRGGNRLTVTEAPRGQKDLYGAIHWALKKFEGTTGRRLLVVFTDGRDGRLSPRWLRSLPAASGRTNGRSPLLNPGQQQMLFRGPPVIPEASEVLDPLFGLYDDEEADEFQRLLRAVGSSRVEMHLIAVGTGHDPQFGPAVVGRPISGLYPGANAAIDGYLAATRSRMELLAAVSGGRMHYGANRDDANTIYSTLDRRLGLGAYRFEVPLATSADAPRIEVRPLKEGLRISQSLAGGTVR